MRHPLTALAGLCLVVPCAPTQVTMTAKSLGASCSVMSVPSPIVKSIAPSTDVTSGYVMTAAGSGSTATATFTPGVSDTSISLLVDNLAYDPLANPQVTQNDVVVTLTSPSPCRAIVSMSVLVENTGDVNVHYQVPMAYTVGAHPPWTQSTYGINQSTNYPVVIDAAGLQITMRAGGVHSLTGFGLFVYNGHARLLATVVPDAAYPFASTPYGSSCGATLSASRVFSQPESTTWIATPTMLGTLAVVSLGTQRVSLALPGQCLLISEPYVILPMTTAGTRFLLTVTPPPIAGLKVTAQAVVVTLGGLAASQGLDLLHP